MLDGKDLIAKAKNRQQQRPRPSAWVCLANLDVNRLAVQALVLCPDRELADQVATEIRRLARTLPNVGLVTPVRRHRPHRNPATLGFGAHIAVGTPGRISSTWAGHPQSSTTSRRWCWTKRISMLDMGFGEDINRVIRPRPAGSPDPLFSATYPGIAQDEPRRATQPGGGERGVPARRERHRTEVVRSAGRPAPRCPHLAAQPPPTGSCVVFCNTKRACNDVG